MDPLSLTANISAVLGAASTAAQGVQRLLRLRDVPGEVLQLQNEVSDSRIVLGVVQQIVAESASQSVDLSIVLLIQELLHRALSSLQHISQIIESGLLKYRGDQELPKLSWRTWMSNRTKLDKETANLRQVRREIGEVLTVLTASEVPRARMILETISLGTDSLRSQVSSLATTMSTNQSTLATLQSLVRQLETSVIVPPRKLALDALLRPQRNGAILNPKLQVQTAIQRRCRPICACVCHSQTNVSIPNWMSALVGRLFIGYSSTPSIVGFSQKCSETSCHRNDTPILKVDYYFPAWFLRRMITFRHQLSPLYSHQISIRTPRLASPENPIFFTSQHGNIEKVRALFSEGLASPFDVNHLSGATPLHLAVAIPSHRSIEMCRLLLNEGADPEQLDPELSSPLDRLWVYLLADPTNSILLQIKEVFSAFVDPFEALQKRRFNGLHYSVLNISALDLGQQLVMSTANIEAKCSMGRTPLLWAVSVCNIEAVKTLLRFGANMDSSDIYGQSVFHRVTARSSGGSPELLGLLIESYLGSCPRVTERQAENALGCNSDAQSRSKESLRTFLNLQEFESSTPLLFTALNNFAEQARILLHHGAKTESPAGSKTHPILSAITHNSHATLKVLLQWHARLDVVDRRDADGVLHSAAAGGDLETMHILTEFGVCCIDTERRNRLRRTPLQEFDENRDEGENEETHHKCREALVRLLDSVRPPSPNHNCWRNGWRTAAKIEHIKDTPDDALSAEDDEEFFDALPFHAAEMASSSNFTPSV